MTESSERGAPETLSVTPSDTNAVTLLEPTTDLKQIRQIVISNSAGAAHTVTITRTNGTDATEFLSAKSIPANDFLILDILIDFPKDWYLDVGVSTGNTISVSIHYVKFSRAGGR